MTWHLTSRLTPRPKPSSGCRALEAQQRIGSELLRRSGVHTVAIGFKRSGGKDLHRIVQAIGGGPVDLFASSGGAVNALALVAKHPYDVRILVAHEPPLCTAALESATSGS
jgi:pimeloyl-ACP methyl ester carboxylesterase